MKIDFPHAMYDQTLPKFEGIASYGSCHDPGQPQTSQIQFKVVTKTVFLPILNDIWEVWGCPGAWHGPYEAIPSSFGGVWSYRTWGKLIFMFFGNIGNSLHHQIPPNWSSGLQIGPRFFFESQGTISGAIKYIIFSKKYPKQNIFSGKLDNLPTSSFLLKWLPFLFLFVYDLFCLY